jgi:hypothetical protein
VIQFLGGTAVVLAVIGFLGKSLVKALFDRDLKTLEVRMKTVADRTLEELKGCLRKEADRELESVKDRLQRERELASFRREARRLRDDRLRTEILRWANPILGSVTDLRRRLNNVLERGAHFSLSRESSSQAPAGWSITYEYFMPSTLFLFAQYFHWVRRMQVEMSFELFETQDDKDQFLNRLWQVSDALSKWPLGNEDAPFDIQVFVLEQRGIGEAVTVRAEASRCLDFAEFMEAWEEGPLDARLAPLRRLLEDVEPGPNGRWQRLQMVEQALGQLEQHCREILQPFRDPVIASEVSPS